MRMTARMVRSYDNMIADTSTLEQIPDISMFVDPH